MITREGGANWEVGTDIRTLLHAEQGSKRGPPYGTGNAAPQYSVMTWMRSES